MTKANDLLEIDRLVARINSWCMPIHHTATAPEDFIDGGESVRCASLRQLPDIRRYLEELEGLLRKVD